MKRQLLKLEIYLLAAGILSICLVSCGPVVHTTATVEYRSDIQMNTPPPTSAGYEMFYNELSPYGRWIDYPGQGYVWVPNAEPGFRPYASNGHWAYSNYGWTWVSNYQWGWAAFHYGSWLYDDYYGWIWVPGHEWAPAWVTWAHSGGYYGWAPLAPKVNVMLAMNGGWTPPAHYWNFVPQEHITKVNINNYVVNQTNNVTVVNNITKNVTIINNNTTVNNTTVINNIHYNQGPQVHEVEKATNNNIQQVTINESARPGTTTINNNQISIYRPQIKPASNNQGAAVPAPAKVEAFRGPVNSIPLPQKGIQHIPSTETNPVKQNTPVNQSPTNPNPLNQQGYPQTNKQVPVVNDVKPYVPKINQNGNIPHNNIQPPVQKQVTPVNQLPTNPNPLNQQGNPQTNKQVPVVNDVKPYVPKIDQNGNIPHNNVQPPLQKQVTPANQSPTNSNTKPVRKPPVKNIPPPVNIKTNIQQP